MTQVWNANFYVLYSGNPQKDHMLNVSHGYWTGVKKWNWISWLLQNMYKLMESV